MKDFISGIKNDFSLKFFVLFLLFSAVMWVLIPTSYYEALHYDPAETLMWGSTFNLGNAKHPPMAGYMLYNFCAPFQFQSFSIFLLSQLVVTLGFIFVYKLARCFYDRPKSVMATLLITFYFLYNYETPKFNANVPHILFVPMMCYYFYKGVSENKLYQWLLLAFSAACAFLTKYYAGVFFLSFLVYMLWDKNARKCFASYKPYLAGLLFFALIAPHLYHLWNSDFMALNYIAEGKERQYGYFTQLGAVLVAILTPLICMSIPAFAVSKYQNRENTWKHWKIQNPEAAKYAGVLIGGQIAVLLLLSLVNQRVETMWTFQMFLPAGILIMAFYPEELNQKTMKFFAVLTFSFAILVMAVDLVHSNFDSSYRRHIKMTDLRRIAEDYYQEQTGSREIPFITGDVWHTSILQYAFKYDVAASPDHDGVLLGIHRDKIRKNGALIITTGPLASEKRLLERYGQKPEWTIRTIPYKARFGEQKEHGVSFGILTPAEPKN